MKKLNEESAADAAKNNYEQKILELTAKMTESDSQNKTLQEQLLKVKQETDTQLQADVGELARKLQTGQKESSQALARVNQEKDELVAMLEEKTNKESSLLAEVTEMQNYIDNMTD